MIGIFFFLYIGTEKENANPGWASLHRQLPLLRGIGVPFVFGFGWGVCSPSPAACIPGDIRNDFS